MNTLWKCIWSLVISGALLLTGCAGGTQAVQTEQPIQTEQPVQSVAPEQIELQYWAMWNQGEAQQEVAAGIIEGYMAEHPNVKINVTWAGRDVLTKIRSAIAGGGAVPEITDMAADELWGAFIKDGIVLQLDEALQGKAYGEDTIWADIFLPGTIQQYQYEGKTYFVPYEVITSAFWYNGNLFKKLGVEPAKTWSEFMDLCDKINASGIPAIGGDNDTWANAYYFYWLSQRINGSGAFFNAAGDTSGASWDSPGFMEVAQKTEEIRTRCLDPNFPGNVWPAGQTDWSMNKSGLDLLGSWLPNEVQSTADPDFEFRGMPFPEIEGGKGKITDVESYLIGYVILKDSAHPQEAIDFLKFALQEKYQMEIVSKGQNMAARKGLEVPEVISDVKGMFDTATSLHKPYDGVQAEYGEWWITILNPLYDQLLTGGITPEKFIQNLKEQSINYWATKPTSEAPLR